MHILVCTNKAPTEISVRAAALLMCQFPIQSLQITALLSIYQHNDHNIVFPKPHQWCKKLPTCNSVRTASSSVCPYSLFNYTFSKQGQGDYSIYYHLNLFTF